MKKILLFCFGVVLSACSMRTSIDPTATPAKPYTLASDENPYRPQPGDASLRLSGVELNNIGLAERFDLDPFRVELKLSGNMPSACHQLRVEIAQPNENYQVVVSVYSLFNPNAECENVLRQFDASVLFGIYAQGRYTVWVNESLIGDFIMY